MEFEKTSPKDQLEAILARLEPSVIQYTSVEDLRAITKKKHSITEPLSLSPFDTAVRNRYQWFDKYASNKGITQVTAQDVTGGVLIAFHNHKSIGYTLIPDKGLPESRFLDFRYDGAD
jgi:hypothetical protein